MLRCRSNKKRQCLIIIILIICHLAQCAWDEGESSRRSAQKASTQRWLWRCRHFLMRVFETTFESNLHLHGDNWRSNLCPFKFVPSIFVCLQIISLSLNHNELHIFSFVTGAFFSQSEDGYEKAKTKCWHKQRQKGRNLILLPSIFTSWTTKGEKSLSSNWAKNVFY